LILNIFYSKIMFHLSQEQWALIQPLFSAPSPPSRGRPVVDQRLALEGILWKFIARSPWYDMPPCYPYYQTCYRRYLLWKRTGLLDQVYRLLYHDLCHRGGFDPRQTFTENRIGLSRVGTRWILNLPPDLENSWQVPVARLIIYLWLEDARPLLKKAHASGSFLSPGI
jgi:transposase